jgi:hypothetical protein
MGARLIAELPRLEQEQADLSALRRKLHDRIDSGFGNEVTLGREGEVSDQRLAMRRRIAAVRLELAEIAEAIA